MGYKTLQAVLEAGKTAVDIAFFPEDPFALDRLAKARGLVAVVDCGVAPGMSSILAAHAVRKLDKARSIKIYVGGLRTMAKTMDVPNMKEKTLRYPGHIEKMAVLRETGFFNTQEVVVKGTRIRPLDFTAEILFPKWKLKEGEADITVMKIIVEGTKENKPLRISYDLFDRYDERTAVHSMARTTGYTATTAARADAAHQQVLKAAETSAEYFS